jgi:hypothetical protein
MQRVERRTHPLIKLALFAAAAAGVAIFAAELPALRRYLRIRRM